MADDFHKELDDFYLAPTQRDNRCIKFALFQTIFLRSKKTGLGEIRPTGGGGEEVDLGRLIGDFLENPTESGPRDHLNDAYRAKIEADPNEITGAFNLARLLWLMNRKPEALELFQTVLGLEDAGHIALPREGFLPHLMKQFSELMPYQLLLFGLVLDAIDRDLKYKRVRAVLMATARVYLALDALTRGEHDEGLNLLEEALSICPEHHPGARLYAKALFVAAKPPDRSAKAILKAIDLYPPLHHRVVALGGQCPGKSWGR
jgi:tetratricopeptide (TPR) repeat protein